MTRLLNQAACKIPDGPPGSSLPRKRESSRSNDSWVPAFAGTTTYKEYWMSVNRKKLSSRPAERGGICFVLGG